jgi:hypothetical protein
VTSFLISCGFCTATAAVLLATQEPHWYVFPVLLCGIIIGCDAVDWFRGRVSLLDPAGVIGLLGVHFFFLAPLLHVTWDAWIPYIDPPSDWRDWLGAMALLNAAGLILYRVARIKTATSREFTPTAMMWQLDTTRLFLFAGVGLAISGALQAWVYATQGGLAGYVESFTEAIGRPRENHFVGMGWIFTISESFPVVAMIVFAAWAGRRRKASSWITLAVVLVGVFALKMLFGGLRGSRMNTIWGLVWAVGIIHLWLRPVNKKFVFAGLAFLLAFMYVYGFYKDLGAEVSTVYEAGALGEYSQELNRTFSGMVLGDLGRADVHAFILYRLWNHDHDHHYAWGRTYLGAIALLVPRSIWPERPPTKVKEGTELLWGVGSYDPEDFVTTYVFGLAGETMFNFGPVAVPFAYLVFGVIVGRLQRFLAGLRRGDARLLLYPFFLTLCMSILTLDSDVLLFLLIKDGLMAMAVVWLSVRVATATEMAVARVAPDGRVSPVV